jgi:hypothetical protein
MKLCKHLTTVALLGLFSTATANTVAASLQLALEKKRLYAYIKVTQTKDISGKLTVVWTPPEDAACDSSEYTLQYKGLSYNTNAYRTVVIDTEDSGQLTCDGEWHVRIIDAHRKELTTSTFTVPAPDGTLSQDNSLIDLDNVF